MPALAALPLGEEPAAEPADTVTQSIDAAQDAGADERIATRLSGIYAELPAFENVQVSVEQGVVSLTGKVPAGEDIDRAENIAARVSGVVTVENDLERDLSLGENVGALGSLKDKIAGFTAMLPLIGFALLVALVISAVGYLIAGLTGLWHRIAPNSFLAELIASAIRFVFVVGGIVIALDMIGAGALMGAVLGGAGVIGVALGFAMRDTIENYVASLMLSLRQPFRANDHVLIDDKEGRIIRLTSRATIMMTLDGNHLRIPNGQVFKAVITNFTRNPQRRFQFDLGVDADDDARAAGRTGRDALNALDFVLDQPPAEYRIVEVGDSNVLVRFLGWIDQTQADWFKSQTLALAAVKAALEDAGFGLPEPIYRLRFDPRSANVPFAGMAQVQAQDEDAGKSSQPPARPGAQPTRRAPLSSDDADCDVRPTDEIRQMVEDERRQTGGEQEKDLLDSGRPVE